MEVMEISIFVGDSTRKDLNHFIQIIVISLGTTI